MENMQLFLSKANILIVDDSPSNVKILTSILKQKEYNNIRNASNSELAIKYAKEMPSDIILININIPGIDGFRICKNFRNNEKLKEIPIILINNYNESIDEEKMFAIGATDYLTIPFNYKEVIMKIETHLKFGLRKLELKGFGSKQQDFAKGEVVKLKKETSNLNSAENESERNQYNYKEAYNKLKKSNEELTQANIYLENKVLERTRQLSEITLELKEFNIMLEEEITERTKTEDALKESERQFRYSIEEAPVPMMLYSEDGEIKKINRTWTDITGYTIKDIPMISEWAKITDAFSEDLEGIDINRLINSNKRQNDGEYSIKTKDGNIRTWNFYSAYIGKLQDGHNLLMRVAIDITERKHMEELQNSFEEERKKSYEIKQYDRIKTEFFSNISHELRTPINVIFSALQIHELKLKNCSFPDRTIDKYKYTKIMKQNCYRLLRLINNIIDITKIDSGYFDINESNIDIINLVENITLSVADYIENKGISLIFDTVVEEKIISCDPEKIERIILNLLSNAVKFTSCGGKIMVNIEDCVGNVCIKIKDTGIGIPEDKLNSIFERFVQVDKSLARNNEGSGIGLSLVKCLVELHDGTISVESKVGYGTEFSIYIPCRLVDKANDEIECRDSIDKKVIEKIHLEFSDIYN